MGLLEHLIAHYRINDKDRASERSVRTEEENRIIGEVAAVFNNQWMQHKRMGNAELFLREVAAIEQNNRTIPTIFLMSGVTDDNSKRLPSFVESAVETAKRLTFLEELTKQPLPDSLVGIIYGGSLSYGKFYNVRGGVDQSDIDMFYIMGR